MLATLFLAMTVQAAGCGAIVEVDPPESGEAYLYQSTLNGEVLDVLMRFEIRAGTGLATTFYQGGGLSRDSIEMNHRSPLRGYGGIAFPRSLGSGPRRREFSYSPSPDEVLSRLAPGGSEDIYVHERNAGAGERYRLTVSFERCADYTVGDLRFPANVYTITREGEDDGEAQVREVWLARSSGWWLIENRPDLQMVSRLIDVND
jgi:hypothetical protein